MVNGAFPDGCHANPAPVRRPDALDPGFHGARTPWIRGFMAFRLARRTRITGLMLST